MRRIDRAVVGLAFSLLAPVAAGAQAAVPNTDIYLAPLSVRDGKVAVGTLVDITNRPGYDNQPSFTPDGRAMLYTAIHEDGQADTYRYDLASRKTARVTTTAESEYSPTVMPGGQRFSVIRVEADSTQRLWSFAMNGSDPRLVLSDMKPVGYHLWLDDRRLALFVLGDPNALVIEDSRGARRDTIARDIGRSLVMIPRARAFSYLQHSGSAWSMARVDMNGHAPPRITTLVTMPRGADYVAWLSPTLALTATGSSLLSWKPGQSDWAPAADLAASGVRRASRLAVSRDGRWLAIVAEPQ